MQLLGWPGILIRLIAHIGLKCIILLHHSSNMFIFIRLKEKLGHIIVFRSGRHQWLHYWAIVKAHQKERKKKETDITVFIFPEKLFVLLA